MATTTIRTIGGLKRITFNCMTTKRNDHEFIATISDSEAKQFIERHSHTSLIFAGPVHAADGKLLGCVAIPASIGNISPNKKDNDLFQVRCDQPFELSPCN